MSSGSVNHVDAGYVSRVLPVWVEPARVFSRLSHLNGAVLLESQPGALGGRYSYICVEPYGSVETLDGTTVIRLSGGVRRSVESPFVLLREMLSSGTNRERSGPGCFAGGAVGYLGYELLTFTEDVVLSPREDQSLDFGVPLTLPSPARGEGMAGTASRIDSAGARRDTRRHRSYGRRGRGLAATPVPDCRMGLYNCAAVFDHQARTVTLAAHVADGVPDAAECMARLEDAVAQACSRETALPVPKSSGGLRSSFSKAEYKKAVERVKEYIAAGDVYQVNISQRFSAPTDSDAWSVYSKLRETNPAPYAAFMNCGRFQIVSSSPESFLTLDPGTRLVTTKPIKGTRPRASDPGLDRRLADELLLSEKDRAENVMIVDLERNDLGRVCEFGSVSVPELFAVESHPTVHHLVSTVTGRLRNDRDAFDLLTASFPGGSITGAPKVRAMEIIEELEPVRRGVYTGCLGYIGFGGEVDLNIAIRTGVVKDGECHFHVGGGIVADSDPEMEYQETLDKGRAFLEVLGCTD